MDAGLRTGLISLALLYQGGSITDAVETVDKAIAEHGEPDTDEQTDELVRVVTAGAAAV